MHVWVIGCVCVCGYACARNCMAAAHFLFMHLHAWILLRTEVYSVVYSVQCTGEVCVYALTRTEVHTDLVPLGQCESVALSSAVTLELHADLAIVPRSLIRMSDHCDLCVCVCVRACACAHGGRRSVCVCVCF